MEKECLHEIKNMKNAVVFSSKTGNTKQLADEIRNVLPEETIKYFVLRRQLLWMQIVIMLDFGRIRDIVTLR